MDVEHLDGSSGGGEEIDLMRISFSFDSHAYFVDEPPRKQEDVKVRSERQEHNSHSSGQLRTGGQHYL